MKSILKKLHTIQTEVQHMAKDGHNDFQNYAYLSETQVTVEMKKLLDKHGVLFTHGSEIKDITELSPTKQGTRQFCVNIKVRYRFYDVESGEFIEDVVAGQGSDTQDKGIYKAITGAIKYIFMKNFLIPTGDDPEKSGEPSPKPQPKPQTKPQSKPDTPKTALTVKQASLEKEGKVFNLMCIVKDTRERQATTKNGLKDVTDYIVHDSGEDMTLLITMFGKTIEGLKQESTVMFKNVKIGTYKGNLTYLAKEIEVV